MSSFHSNTVGDLRNSASARDYTVFGSICPEFPGLSAKETLVSKMMRYMVVMQRRDFLWRLSAQACTLLVRGVAMFSTDTLLVFTCNTWIRLLEQEHEDSR
jgi:hypothetical protein